MNETMYFALRLSALCGRARMLFDEKCIQTTGLINEWIKDEKQLSEEMNSAIGKYQIVQKVNGSEHDFEIRPLGVPAREQALAEVREFVDTAIPSATGERKTTLEEINEILLARGVGYRE